MTTQTTTTTISNLIEGTIFDIYKTYFDSKSALLISLIENSHTKGVFIAKILTDKGFRNVFVSQKIVNKYVSKALAERYSGISRGGRVTQVAYSHNGLVSVKCVGFDPHFVPFEVFVQKSTEERQEKGRKLFCDNKVSPYGEMVIGSRGINYRPTSESCQCEDHKYGRLLGRKCKHQHALECWEANLSDRLASAESGEW